MYRVLGYQDNDRAEHHRTVPQHRHTPIHNRPILREETLETITEAELNGLLLFCRQDGKIHYHYMDGVYIGKQGEPIAENYVCLHCGINRTVLL